MVIFGGIFKDFDFSTNYGTLAKLLGNEFQYGHLGNCTVQETLVKVSNTQNKISGFSQISDFDINCVPLTVYR